MRRGKHEQHREQAPTGGFTPPSERMGNHSTGAYPPKCLANLFHAHELCAGPKHTPARSIQANTPVRAFAHTGVDTRARARARAPLRRCAAAPLRLQVRVRACVRAGVRVQVCVCVRVCARASTCALCEQEG
eukprot:5344711-Pleurochrysis_carterae.AAC.1